jgi:hypothetical protein
MFSLLKKVINPSTSLWAGYEASGSYDKGILDIFSSFPPHKDNFRVAE